MKSIYDNKDFFEAYAQMTRSKEGLKGAGEWHQLKLLFPNMKDKVVLDMGCGYGWHSKYAAQQGAASVVAFDMSDKMIEEANKRNSGTHINYEVCEISEYSYPANTYDVVISNLVLHYIENLDDVFESVYKTLKDGGIFIFNIEHPTFTAGVNQEWILDKDEKPQAWPIDNYFYPGERQTNFLGHTITKQHHTLTQILMGLIKTGFKLEVVEEAQPSEEMMDIPGMRDEMRRPIMLLVKAVK